MYYDVDDWGERKKKIKNRDGVLKGKTYK